ncbi:MFS transporter [Nocardiopsis halophila]|uniref:MFS transporter n=1 Tax=Nocardiopsis halophila TaxID=141692 RepID=UPI00034A0B71|nr:MFS transporter [Nocardiopsis halophila]
MTGSPGPTGPPRSTGSAPPTGPAPPADSGRQDGDGAQGARVAAASTATSRARPSRGLGPGFGRLWSAYTSGNLADGMALTAFPLVAAFLTTDPLLVSGLMAVRYLPWLLLGALAGAVVDRVDRVAAMRVSGAVRAGTMGVLALLLATGSANIWALYAAMFTVMTCETVYDSAARAHLPALVGRGRLDAANSRLEGGRVLAEDCAGAPAAGLLFGVAALLPIAAGGLAFLLSAVLLIGIPATARRADLPGRGGAVPEARPAGAARGPVPSADVGPDAGPGAGTPRRGLVRAVAADTAVGFRFILGDRVQAGLAVYGTGCSIGFQTASAVLVLYAQQILGVPAHLYGFFLASAALGALAGALAAAPLGRRIPKAVLISGGFALVGAAVAGMGLVASAAAAAVLWALMGFANSVGNVLALGVLQTITPDRLLGRVQGARRTLGWGLAPVGALLGGLLGRIDLALPLVVGGSLVMAMPLLFSWAIVGAVRRAGL